MKNLKITNPFRKLSHVYIALILISCAFMVACDIGDDMEDIFPDTTYPVSYATFSITGPIFEGGHQYRDGSADDDFSALGTLNKKVDDPELSEDQIQLYVGKSLEESYFLLVAPPQTGSYNFAYLNNTSDFDIRIQLSSPEELYYVKEVSVNIIELEITGTTVTHCEGTFTGQFYRNNLVETDVHQINGSFEINRKP